MPDAEGRLERLEEENREFRAENERLKAENLELKTDRADFQTGCREAEAEVERLRKQLAERDLAPEQAIAEIQKVAAELNWVYVKLETAFSFGDSESRVQLHTTVSDYFKGPTLREATDAALKWLAERKEARDE